MTNHHNDESTNGTPSESADNTELLRLAGTTALAIAIIEQLIHPPLFSLGQVVATPGAIDLLDRTGTNATGLLNRHQHGDFGDMTADDVAENMRALKNGDRVLSAYELGPNKEKLWILTEYDRSVTTLLLPMEY